MILNFLIIKITTISLKFILFFKVNNPFAMILEYKKSYLKTCVFFKIKKMNMMNKTIYIKRIHKKEIF